MPCPPHHTSLGDTCHALLTTPPLATRGRYGVKHAADVESGMSLMLIVAIAALLGGEAERTPPTRPRGMPSELGHVACPQNSATWHALRTWPRGMPSSPHLPRRHVSGMGYLLSKDVDAMVIQPIESMVDSVTKVRHCQPKPRRCRTLPLMVWASISRGAARGQPGAPAREGRKGALRSPQLAPYLPISLPTRLR